MITTDYFRQAELLQSLRLDIQNIINTVKTEFAGMDLPALNYKRSPGSWSILECIEHLNRYNRYYNQAFQNALSETPRRKRNELHTGWMSRYILNGVDPVNIRKQNTLKHLNPAGSMLDKSVIGEFISHQEQLLQLLGEASDAELNTRNVPVEFMKLLKMSLGTALLFVCRHEQRHITQAMRVKQAAQS